LSGDFLDVGAFGGEFVALAQFSDDLFGRVPFTSSHEL